jgi:hypothetical protein
LWIIVGHCKAFATIASAKSMPGMLLVTAMLVERALFG